MECLKLNLTNVKESLFSAIDLATKKGLQLGRTVVNLGSSACATAGPKLQAVANRIQSIPYVSSGINVAKEFFKTNSGHAGGALGLAITAFAITRSDNVKSTLVRGIALVVGVSAGLFAAAKVFKPGFVLFGVKI